MRRAGAVDRHPTAISMMLRWFEPLSEAIAAEQQQASSASFRQHVDALRKILWHRMQVPQKICVLGASGDSACCAAPIKRTPLRTPLAAELWN